MTDNKGKFRLYNKDEPIEWPVQFPVPTPEGPRTAEYVARFVYLTDKELEEAARTDVGFLKAIMRGWNIQQTNGAALPFNDEGMQLLASYGAFIKYTYRAYKAFLEGRIEKN